MSSSRITGATTYNEWTTCTALNVPFYTRVVNRETKQTEEVEVTGETLLSAENGYGTKISNPPGQIKPTNESE
jgi:hypothetical protein